MARFTIRGEVLPFSATQRNIRVHNVEELRQFWAEERIDTKLDWGRPEELATVSNQALVQNCQVGDIVDYMIDTWDRADGRRTRGVALKVVTPAGP